MLSTGTRIGTTRILSWLGEGSTGQSYHCESTEGDLKGNLLYVKLIHREVSERNGFEDYFHQECQTLEQLEGPGIWPIREFGVKKWKHWIGYDWLEGESLPVEGEEEGAVIRSLAELMEFNPSSLTPELLLNFMISLHRGLYRIHQSGIAHGNMKPSNVLVRKAEDGSGEAWVTETGLFRMGKFRAVAEEESSGSEVFSLNQDGRDSRDEADRFRPGNPDDRDVPDENWDIFALGKIVRWAIEKAGGKDPQWDQWNSWAKRAYAERPDAFPSIAHSMQALPGVGDLSEYGVKADELSEDQKLDLEALKAKREREWALSEKLGNLRFRRNMTGLVGGLILSMFLFSSIYLFFLPVPWTEYSLAGNTDIKNTPSDSYQLGAGFRSGNAWGIVPPACDEKGQGGQSAQGQWERENGLFKLSFRRLKKSKTEESGKKRSDLIFAGKTSPDDYSYWIDYLRHDASREALILVKREYKDEVFVPGREGKGAITLYPELRLKKSTGRIAPAELAFFREGKSGFSWSLFFGLGFMLAWFIYHRELRKLETDRAESIE
jgi:hypothetical protein